LGRSSEGRSSGEGGGSSQAQGGEQPLPDVGSDIANTIMPALRRGGEMVAAAPGEVNEATKSGIAYIARKIFGDEIANQMGKELSESPLTRGLTGTGPQLPEVKKWTNENVYNDPDPYVSQTEPGKIAGRVLEQVPAMAIPGMGPRGLVMKGLDALLSGAGSYLGEKGGQWLQENLPDDLLKGSGVEGYLPDMATIKKYLPLAGEIAGGAGGSTLAGAGKPKPTQQELAHEEGLRTLEKEGVKPTGGQASGSPLKAKIEATLGGDALLRRLDQQQGAFTDAAMRKTGAEGGPASTEALSEVRETLGRRFDELAARSTVPFDQRLQDDMLKVAATHADASVAVAPGVEKIMNRAGELAAKKGGVLSGEDYQHLSSELRTLADAAGPEGAKAFNDLRGALDDAVERNLSGKELADWQKVRNQWSNFRSIERSIPGGAAGEGSAGQVTPTRLREGIQGGPGEGDVRVAEGRSELSKLANAGQNVLTKQPTPQGLVMSLIAGGTGPAVMNPVLQAALKGPSRLDRSVLAKLRAGAIGGRGSND
jgi:hypothetical protein